MGNDGVTVRTYGEGVMLLNGGFLKERQTVESRGANPAGLLGKARRPSHRDYRVSAHGFADGPEKRSN